MRDIRICGLGFNIKKLRVIKELWHKGRKEDAELRKDFLNHIRHIRAYKFVFFHCATLCTTLCATVKLIHDNLVVVAQRAQRRHRVAQRSLNHIRHIRAYKFGSFFRTPAVNPNNPFYLFWVIRKPADFQCGRHRFQSVLP
jgi:hypothetical protein